MPGLLGRKHAQELCPGGGPVLHYGHRDVVLLPELVEEAVVVPGGKHDDLVGITGNKLGYLVGLGAAASGSAHVDEDHVHSILQQPLSDLSPWERRAAM